MKSTKIDLKKITTKIKKKQNKTQWITVVIHNTMVVE